VKLAHCDEIREGKELEKILEIRANMIARLVVAA